MKKGDDNAELLVRYLLGQLSEQESVRLEQLFFTDDEFQEQLLAVEDELRYDYSQGRLEKDRRDLFERKFLNSSADRKRTALASALLTRLPMHAEADAADRDSASTKSSWWIGLTSLFGLQGTAARVAFAAIGLLLVGGSIWLLVQTIRLQAQIENLRAERASEVESLQAQAAQERSRSGVLNEQLETEREQRSRVEREIARLKEMSKRASDRIPSVVSLILTPGVLRDPGQETKRVVVTAGTELVRLQLERKNDASSKTYRAVIANADGDTVWSKDPLKPRKAAAVQSVTLELPARVLAEDDYEVTLYVMSAAGEMEPAGYYRFRVVKK